METLLVPARLMERHPNCFFRCADSSCRTRLQRHFAPITAQPFSAIRAILDDKSASKNDHFVAMELLKNANIAAAGVLPMCQDTGTAIIMGKKGQNIFTGFDDEEALSQGVYNTYINHNLRYSQLAPLDMFAEKNTGSNLPAQIEIYATPGDEYKFAFIQKGGGRPTKLPLSGDKSRIKSQYT